MNIRPPRPLALLALGVVTAAWLAACGGGARERLPGTAEDTGRRVFAAHCAHCHAAGAEHRIGPGLAGLFEPGGPALPAGIDYGGNLPNGAAITRASVAAWIRSGGQGQIGRMPGITLSDQEMSELIAYLATLGTDR
ncbi:MAG TPA: c-type cytochrome [Roseiflexaceae bacterium]|nr:c-type cytochrome [Roseiflexaceae bacterium]